MPIHLLFVCLGNICRSPAAEGIFLHQIMQRGLEDLFIVDSAGTSSWHIGCQADPRMQAAAKRRGINLPSRARQIKPDDLSQFDLILTMDTDNQAVVEALAKQADAGAKAEIRPMLSFARRYKLLDVPDPYFTNGEKGFEQVLDLLEDCCDGLLEELLSTSELAKPLQGFVGGRDPRSC